MLQQVSYIEPKPSDLPIIGIFRPSQSDKDFASLELKHSKRDTVITILKSILETAFLTIFTERAWLYSIYLLYRLDDAQGILVIIRFLERYNFFGFNIKVENKIMKASFKVLRHYNTPEALEALEMYSDLDNSLSKVNYKPGSTWIET